MALWLFGKVRGKDEGTPSYLFVLGPARETPSYRSFPESDRGDEGEDVGSQRLHTTPPLLHPRIRERSERVGQESWSGGFSRS